MIYKEDFFYTHNTDWAWLRIPKNASNTMTKILDVGFSDCYFVDDIDWSKVNKCFMITRNPYDRIVSCWKNRIVEMKRMGTNPELIGLGFKDFIKKIHKIPDDMADEHFRTQTWYYNLCPIDNLKVIEINDIPNNKYLEDIVGHKYNVPVMKKSNRKKDYKTYFDDETIELVKERYANDLVNFNYSY